MGLHQIRSDVDASDMRPPPNILRPTRQYIRMQIDRCHPGRWKHLIVPYTSSARGEIYPKNDGYDHRRKSCLGYVTESKMLHSESIQTRIRNLVRKFEGSIWNPCNFLVHWEISQSNNIYLSSGHIIVFVKILYCYCGGIFLWVKYDGGTKCEKKTTTKN